MNLSYVYGIGNIKRDKKITPYTIKVVLKMKNYHYIAKVCVDTM